jgi:hypothetical protein
MREDNQLSMRLGVDVGVPQSRADERSYLLVNLFGDNEVPYSNDHPEYGSMTRCETDFCGARAYQHHFWRASSDADIGAAVWNLLSGLDFHPRALSVAMSGWRVTQARCQKPQWNGPDPALRSFTYGDLFIYGSAMTLRRAIYSSRLKGFSCSVGVVHFKQKISPVFFQINATCRIEVFFGTSGSSEP